MKEEGALMYRTARETQQQTLTRLLKAMDREQPVTITYTKADGTETVRTIELYEVQTTKAGDIVIKAMDRDSWEPRHWRLDRIRFYTVHRARPVIAVEEPVEPAPVPQTVAELTAWEIARDDRDYWNDRYDVEPDSNFDYAA